MKGSLALAALIVCSPAFAQQQSTLHTPVGAADRALVDLIVADNPLKLDAKVHAGQEQWLAAPIAIALARDNFDAKKLGALAPKERAAVYVRYRPLGRALFVETTSRIIDAAAKVEDKGGDRSLQVIADLRGQLSGLQPFVVYLGGDKVDVRLKSDLNQLGAEMQQLFELGLSNRGLTAAQWQKRLNAPRTARVNKVKPAPVVEQPVVDEDSPKGFISAAAGAWSPWLILILTLLAVVTATFPIGIGAHKRRRVHHKS